MYDFEHEIQVSGNENFPANEWQEAIRYYLDGVRTNNEAVMYRPKIFFGGLTLRREGDHYTVKEVGAGNPDVITPLFTGPSVLHATCDTGQVEQGLERLVESRHLRMLVIAFAEGSTMSLWKKEDGTYGIHAVNASPQFPFLRH